MVGGGVSLPVDDVVGCPSCFTDHFEASPDFDPAAFVDAPVPRAERDGCGCTTSAGSPAGLALVALVLATIRRRKR